MYFRYGSQDAYLLVGSTLYYLGGGPDRRSGGLEWNTTDNNDQIDIRVSCPPPPRTGPLTRPETPSACAVLTASIARAAVRDAAGPAKFTQENPELSYCSYTSRDGRRQVSLSLGSAAELVQLASWQQPSIRGLGDAAHGGDPGDGIAVRSGKLGLEVTVDLGIGTSDAANLAAEQALARRLLSHLAG